MKKFCIISNSNLGAFFKYIKLFNKRNSEFLVISSKKDIKKKKTNIPIIYINNNDSSLFNKKAYEECKKFKPRKIILFYTKKIEKIIYKNFKTINIHNSLLPHYGGLNALRRTFNDGNKLICSTSHIVDEKFDNGKILIQLATATKQNNLKFFNKIAFYHRVLLLYANLMEDNIKKKYSIINDHTIISPGLNRLNLKLDNF